MHGDLGSVAFRAASMKGSLWRVIIPAAASMQGSGLVRVTVQPARIKGSLGMLTVPASGINFVCSVRVPVFGGKVP